jgi:hypothetical protein
LRDVGGARGERVRKQPLFELPVASTSLAEDPDLVADGGRILLRLVFGGADDRVHWQVEFANVRAFRHRAESHCTAWHIEDAYDVVCHVEDSEWVGELLRDSLPDGKNWVMNHYLVTVDSWGCLEVVAESAAEGETERVAVQRVLRAFERDPGEALIGTWPLKGIKLVELQELFKLPPDDPMYACYPVETRHVPRLQAAVSHKIDLEAFDYFVEADAVSLE